MRKRLAVQVTAFSTALAGTVAVTVLAAGSAHAATTTLTGTQSTPVAGSAYAVQNNEWGSSAPARTVMEIEIASASLIVIPAKAGIRSATSRCSTMDPGFRRDDGCKGGPLFSGGFRQRRAGTAFRQR